MTTKLDLAAVAALIALIRDNDLPASDIQARYVEPNWGTDLDVAVHTDADLDRWAEHLGQEPRDPETFTTPRAKQWWTFRNLYVPRGAWGDVPLRVEMRRPALLWEIEAHRNTAVGA